jgi:hypothetical protein
MGIDLNAVEGGGAGVCGELWHACAGAGVALPRQGSAVVYLPQAHLAAGGGDMPSGAAAVPPHVVCRVVDVELCVSALLIKPYASDLAFVAGKEGEKFTGDAGVRLRAGGCGDGRGVRAARARRGGQRECSFHRSYILGRYNSQLIRLYSVTTFVTYGLVSVTYHLVTINNSLLMWHILIVSFSLIRWHSASGGHTFLPSSSSCLQ